MTDNRYRYSQIIKEEALQLGFFSCGISQAGFLENEAPRLEKWLQEGKHGNMTYMESHFDKRLDPRLLVPDAKSVVSLLFNYYPETSQDKDTYKISKYAYGADYHDVIKQKLTELIARLQEKIGAFSCRSFVDSAPVLDKAWAAKSGLGWVGKNSNLITKQVGSFYFIAEIILDVALAYDTPTTDHCGSCTACIDACPTQAIVAPYVVDGSKCISYATIELKENMPDYFRNKLDDWIFGCDVCQDVCPWNRFAQTHQEPLLQPVPEVLHFSKKEWQELTEITFKELFKKSPIKRSKYSGLMRNIRYLSQS